MKVMVTGSKGQLGYDVALELSAQNIETVGLDKNEMDITNYSEVKTKIMGSNIDAIVHCAAYTAVDSAEDNTEVCEQINVQGTRNIAEVCKDLNIAMVYISTDYVFDGSGNVPWETNSIRNPINFYGHTKNAGEIIVESLLTKYFIVRISWVFGENGNNFIKTMLKLSRQHTEINVVNDQFGSPTYTKDLSKLLVDMVSTDKYGTYHATNEGFCTWYEFAQEIFRITNSPTKVNPVDSKTFPVKAKRPHNSMMSKDKLTKMGFKRLPSWQDALNRFISELNINNL